MTIRSTIRSTIEYSPLYVVEAARAVIVIGCVTVIAFALAVFFGN